MFKVNNKDIGTISKRHFGAFVVNLFLFLVFTVGFEQLLPC